MGWGIFHWARYGLVFSCLSSSLWGALHFPPETRTSKDYGRFLHYLQQEMPLIFEQGAEYDVNLLEILKSQQEAVEALKNSAMYMEAARNRPELVTLKLQMMGNQTIKSSKINRFKILDLLEEAGPSVAHLSSKDLTDAVLSPEPQGELTGLIQCHPQSATKARLFKLAPLDALTEMENDPNFTDQSITKHFQFNRHGIRNPLTKSQLISRIRENILKKRDLKAFLVFRALQENDLSLAVESVPPELSDNVRGKAFVAQIMGGLGNGSQDLAHQLKEKINPTWDDLSRSLQTTHRQEKEVVLDEITLKEVPPYLGIFRGFVGGDCSTQFTYLFPYAPNEKTFFVIDPEGVPRGYVMATRLRIQGANALYVHDIVGPTLSRRMVDMILWGLQGELARFGARYLVLPNEKRIFDNNNYEFLRTHLQSYVAGLPGLRLQYEDAAIRTDLKNLGQFAVDYDSPEANPSGHIFNPPRSAKWDQFKISASENLEGDAQLPEIDEKQAILLALDLRQAARSDSAQKAVAAAIAITTNPQAFNLEQRALVAEEILNEAGIDRELFELFDSALTNSEGESVEDYYRRLESLGGRLGLELPALLKDKPYFFYEGHLRSSNALTPGNSDHARRSIDFAIHLLKRWPKPDIALEVIRHHIGSFNAEERFRNYLHSLLNDQHADAERLEGLLSDGASVELFRSALERIKILAKSRIISVKRVANQLLIALGSVVSPNSDGCAGEVANSEED